MDEGIVPGGQDVGDSEHEVLSVWAESDLLLLLSLLSFLALLMG